jgi:hypothetical protein
MLVVQVRMQWQKQYNQDICSADTCLHTRLLCMGAYRSRPTLCEACMWMVGRLHHVCTQDWHVLLLREHAQHGTVYCLKNTDP